MSIRRAQASFISAIVLAGITAALFYFSERLANDDPLKWALLLVLGMTATAALRGFLGVWDSVSDDGETKLKGRYIEGEFTEIRPVRSDEVAMIELHVRNATGALSPNASISRSSYKDTAYLEPTAEDLVGRDNALALAKLRMDIEAKLRKVAESNNIDPRQVSLGPMWLGQDLARRGILPMDLLAVMNDVIKTCNSAIHGAEVTNDDAYRIVDAGRRLLDYLDAKAQTPGY